jgi:hypothetical protein
MVESSPGALETEKALINAIADGLPATEAAEAMNFIGDGGPADEVVSRIRDRFPGFRHHSPELGAGGSMAGQLRSRNLKGHKKEFQADGIELRVPLDRLDRVVTIQEEDGLFETRIRTNVPLTPLRNLHEVGDT